jgi:hypothetical protein
LRDDRLISVNIVPVEFQEEQWNLNENLQPTPEQLQLKNAWLAIKDGARQGK